jgi:hypothetical protein
MVLENFTLGFCSCEEEIKFWAIRASSQNYPVDSGSTNFITLPGLRPAAVATPVGIETIPKNSEFNEPPGNPAQGISYWGRGRDGVKLPPVYIFVFLFFQKDYQK